MDYEYIKQKDVENEIKLLDEFEKRQLYQFLTETKKIVPKNDIFVIPSKVLPEVKDIIDFMKKNKQASFKTQEEEKERMKDTLEQSNMKSVDTSQETLEKRKNVLVSIPIVQPIYELAKILLKCEPQPESAKGVLLQPVLKRGAAYYENNPVLSRIFSRIKQNEKENSVTQHKKTKYVSPGYTTAPLPEPTEEEPPEPEIDQEESFDDDATEVGDEPDEDSDEEQEEEQEEAEEGDIELKGQIEDIVPSPKVPLVVGYLQEPVPVKRPSRHEEYE